MERRHHTKPGGGWLTRWCNNVRGADIGLMCDLWKLTTTHLQPSSGLADAPTDLLTRSAFISHRRPPCLLLLLLLNEWAVG